MSVRETRATAAGDAVVPSLADAAAATRQALCGPSHLRQRPAATP